MKIDLSGILTPEVIAKAKAKATQKAKAAPTPTPAPLPLPAAPSSPWVVEARVLLRTVVTCACGAQWEVPGSPEPLVRSRHKRNGTLWEVADHPARFRQDIPKTVRTIPGKCTACPACWEETEETQAQLEFPFTLETPRH